MRSYIYLGALAFALTLVPESEAIAQSHCQSYWTAAYKCAQGCGCAGGGGNSGSSTYTPPAPAQPSPADLQQRQMVALQQQGLTHFHAGKYAEALRLFELSLKMCVAADDIQNLRESIGNTHTRLGGIAYKRGDVEQANREFELAKQYLPNNAANNTNLATTRNDLAYREQARIAEQQDKAAASNMQKAIAGFAQTLNAAPSSGGLDFDGRTGGSPAGPSGNGSGLDFASAVPATKQTGTVTAAAVPQADPRVVDARDVPSGLSKPVEDAIAGAYARSPPGVSDRVRKGFQAVADRDWRVAKAWFEEALFRDPGNARLKQLVELAGNAPERGRQAAATTARQESAPQSPNSGGSKASPMSDEALNKALDKAFTEALLLNMPGSR
jgi:tetratricopeptide (TPR) repeat protein